LLDKYSYNNNVEYEIFFLAKQVTKSMEGNQLREKVLAHLISMTVQLKYLLVERFEWLLHVVQYVRHSFIYKLSICSRI
jgi:hypothetical protein